VPRVSVLVVSYNRADDLKLALEAIFATRWPDLEVIVVDNASTDSAATVAQSIAGVKLIRSPDNLGFAAGNNLALAQATGEFVALVNNDAVIAPDWIETLVQFLENHERTAAAGGREYFWNDDNPLGARTNHFLGPRDFKRNGEVPAATDVDDDVREVATLPGMAVMIRRAAIDDVGAPFLDPTFFMYYEETDLFARAVRKGWRLHYVAAAACWHRTAGKRVLPRAVEYHLERNRILFAWRHSTHERALKLEDRLRRRALAATWEGPLRRLTGDRSRADRSAARRDAWKWVNSNRALLAEHRARYAQLGPPFDALARTIQSRADYYGKPRPEVAALVPESSRNVLDVGCAGGGLGRTVKALRPAARVRGIEPVSEAAAVARTVLDDVAIGTADSALPAHWPKPDCVIFSDVLEHTVDPWKVLRRWRADLAPGGTLVVSLPNVTHESVLGPLLRGRFEYEDEGVLDRTHLRFFTRTTAIELLESCGFEITSFARVEARTRGGLMGALRRSIARRQIARERSSNSWRTPGLVAADRQTLQFLFTAR
jgi:GT2 family glycosyltransferase/ubiquinone/menaquinone biosynthesis C-methylase UbiE